MSTTTANRFSALSIDDEAHLSMPKTKVPVAGIPKRVPMAYVPPHLRSQQSQQQIKSKEEFPSLTIQRSTPPSIKPTLSFADKVKTELPKQSPPKPSTVETKYTTVSTPSPYWKLKQESFRRYSPEHEHEYEEQYSGEDLDHDVYGQTYNYSNSKSNSNSKYGYNESSEESEQEEDDQDY